MLRYLFAIFALLTLISRPAHAQDLEARVVDVGPGLCVVISVPGGYEMLYDAGHWNSSNCHSAVQEMVHDERLEMVVISHSDSDHLGELPEILGDKKAGVILMTGHRRTTATYGNAIDAISASIPKGTTVLNLETWPIRPGTVFHLGPAQVTFVAGWHEWDPTLSDHNLEESELRNVISIVMKVEYEGKSILLAGDTVGRSIGAPVDTCDDAERFMVTNNPTLLKADVLIGGHHGADNASSTCFIEAVAPEFVIFSAGHAFRHPRAATAARVLAAGISTDRIFRTDRGDDEGTDEWDSGRIITCTDGRGDDDILITLPSQTSGPADVRYLELQSGC